MWILGRVIEYVRRLRGYSRLRNHPNLMRYCAMIFTLLSISKALLFKATQSWRNLCKLNPVDGLLLPPVSESTTCTSKKCKASQADVSHLLPSGTIQDQIVLPAVIVIIITTITHAPSKVEIYLTSRLASFFSDPRIQDFPLPATLPCVVSNLP